MIESGCFLVKMPAANFDFTHRWATTTFANSIELIHAPLVNRFGMNSQLTWQLEFCSFSCSFSYSSSLLNSTTFTSWLVSSSYYWFYIHPLHCVWYGSVSQIPLEWAWSMSKVPPKPQIASRSHIQNIQHSTTHASSCSLY